MAFDPNKFTRKLKRTLDDIAEDYAKEGAKLVEADVAKRLKTQVGYQGATMPKKKHPQKSKHPDQFLVDTGESMKMDVTRISPGHYRIQARRPEILNYPNPRKGLVTFWGISKELKDNLSKLLKETVKKWLK